jgi:hypothetical protein
MSPSGPFEEPPVFLRVYEDAKRTRTPRAIREDRPNDHLLLVFDTETTTDVRQELRFGVARLYADGHAYRTIVFTREVSKREAAVITDWAQGHTADVLTVERFVDEVFLPLAFDMRALVVGFNLPFDLSTIAANWEPRTKGSNKDTWTLWLVPRSDPRAAYTPRIRIQSIDSTKAFIKFTGTKRRSGRIRGAFVDLRTFTHALTGERHSLKSAAEAFGCQLGKTQADYHGPVAPGYLDYCLNDVILTEELYQRCLGRYREFGLAEHPSRIYSPASLAKAVLKARGIEPPSLTPKIRGEVMASFYGGKVEIRVVGREVPDVAVLDFASQYPSLYIQLGVERFLTALEICSRDATEEVRTFVDATTLEDGLRPETLQDPRMWAVCDVEATGEILPFRSTYSGRLSDAPTIGWNHGITQEGLTLPYMVADLLAAKLLRGKAPRIVRATMFEAVGHQELTPLTILGVSVGASDNLIRTLTEARIREKKERKRGWENRALGLKILANALCYGIFVEVNRKGNSGQATIHGIGPEPFETEEKDLEEPGIDYCPLLATAITSAAHLLLALGEAVVEKLGGEVVYCDTDSMIMTPSRIAPQVAARLESLNPFSSHPPFLKDETDEKAPRNEYPKDSVDSQPRFVGLSAKRYCLLVRDRRGRPHVFRASASDHGLGGFESPGKREDRANFIAKVWEDIITLGEAAADRYVGIPVTSRFSVSSPSLIARVRKLGPIRPFRFLTARGLEPSSDPNEPRSELIAYIPTTDELARLRLMDLPRQRSWASVLESFIRHRDRKYNFDDGRMVRRHILVRNDRLIGLGKEANRIELSRVLGSRGGGDGHAKRYVDWRGRILALPPSWAKAQAFSERSFRHLRQALRSGRIPRGHGSKTFNRVCEALSSEWTAGARPGANQAPQVSQNSPKA